MAILCSATAVVLGGMFLAKGPDSVYAASNEEAGNPAQKLTPQITAAEGNDDQGPQHPWRLRRPELD